MLSILFLSKLQFKSFERPFVKQPKNVLKKIIYNFHLLVAFFLPGIKLGQGIIINIIVHII